MDGRIKPLWDEIINRVRIREEKSHSGGWGVKVDANGQATISTCDTKSPVECLAHELLHVKLQLDGYRRLRLIVWPADKTGRYGAHLLTASDNELQHHRMFPLFQTMGFDGTKSYKAQ